MENKINDEYVNFTERQYERLIKARNYHYDNIGKWLRFFYLIIGALFVGYYTVHNAHSGQKAEIVIMILGYIVSLACYLSAKGHYYWELSWIQMLHNYEKKELELESKQKVYSAFANKEGLNHPWLPVLGANVSTSKIALLVNLIVAVLWGAMLAYSTIKPLIDPSNKYCLVFGALVLSAAITYFVTAFAAIALKSEMNKIEDLELV